MCKCSKISSPIMSHRPLDFPGFPALLALQKGPDSLRTPNAAPNAPLACSVRKTPRAVPQPAVARAPVLQMVITRAPEHRPAAWEPWGNHGEIMGNHGKSWKIMENHGKSWEIMGTIVLEISPKWWTWNFTSSNMVVFMGFDGIFCD